MSYRTQEVLRIIGIVLLTVLVIGLVAMLGSSLLNRQEEDNYSKVNVKWSRGALDEAGAFVKNETDSLASDPIAIEEGLKVVIDFDKTVKYNVFFYDSDNIYLGTMSGGATTSNKVLTRESIESTYAKAEFFRIVLMDVDDDDGYITFFEKGKFGNYVTVYTASEAVSSDTATSTESDSTEETE